jgi:hypothetical protein
MIVRSSLCLGALAAALLLGATGCGSGGPKLHKVSGTVTLDGQPLAGADVNFEPDDYAGGLQAASGRTTTDGSYTLTTYTSGDGAMEGNYKVTISKTGGDAQSGVGGGPPGNPSDPKDMMKMGQMMQKMSQAGKGAAPAKAKNEIHPDYSDMSKTILKMKVPPPNGRADFPLKKGGGL